MMATSGRTLASLHKQLTGFQPSGQHHLGFTGYDEDRLRDIPWHAKKIEELVNLSSNIKRPEDRQQADLLVKTSADLFQELSDLNEVLKNSNLPRIIIHGDYGLHNLIYTNLDYAVPVDYELSRLEWRLSDLVSVISKFRYKDGSYDFESITRFLHAYQKEYPISDDEWQLFPLVWKYYKLMKAVQYWISYFETDGPVRKLFSSRSEAKHSNWALENPSRLAEFRVKNL
jgi:Ser/Thr protein kinase RdoA (MazF antagonist)